jgi:transitional endoplasmic reticulum ATPase
MLAQAFANETNRLFYSLSLDIIGSKYINQTGNNIALFHAATVIAAKRTNLEGVILHLEECDGLLGVRTHGTSGDSEGSKVANIMCDYMDGFKANPKVIWSGTTNRRELIDPAFLRPGRFDEQLLIDAPDKKGIKALYQSYAEHLKRFNKQSNFKGLNYNKLTSLSSNYTGADVAYVMKESIRRFVYDLIKKNSKNAVNKYVGMKTVLEVIKEHNKKKIESDNSNIIGFKGEYK